MAGVDPLALKGVLLEGHVTIERALSETPYFVAYRAVVRGLGEPVALKAFRVSPKADEARVSAFLEAIASCAGRIDELSRRDPAAPSLVSYGLATAGGNRVPYVATRWIDGPMLAAELDLRTAAVPTPEIGGWLRDVAGVLDAAHDLSVIHGDLSPATLLVEKVTGGAPRLRVTDFGLAALLQTFGAEMAQAATYEPKNAPPEQLDPVAPERSPQCDVHALALTVLETMLPRLKRKTGPLAQRKKRSLEAADRPTPKKLGLAIPPALAEVFERATAAKAADRFPSVSEFLDALRRAEPAFSTASMAPVRAAPAKAAALGQLAAAKRPGLDAVSPGAAGHGAPAAAVASAGLRAEPPPRAADPRASGSGSPLRIGGASDPPPPLRIGGASDPPPPLRIGASARVSEGPRGMGSGFAIPAIPPAPKAPAFANAHANANANANEPSAGIEAGPAAPVDERDRAFGESTAVDRLPEGLVDAPVSEAPLSRTQEGSSRGETTAVDLIAPASEPPSPPSQIPPSGGTAVMASRPEVPARVEPASADATRMAIPVDARLAGVLAARPERPDPTPAPAPLDAARSHSVDPRVTAPMVPVSVAMDAPAVPEDHARAEGPPPEVFNPSRTQPLGPTPTAQAVPFGAGFGAAPPHAPVGPSAQGSGLSEPALGAPAFVGTLEPSAPGPVAERGPSQPMFAPSPSGQHAHATPGPALAPGEARQPAPAASLEARNAAFERRPSQGHYVDDDPPTPPLESSRPLVIGGAIGAVVLVLVAVGFALGGRKSAPVAEPTAPSSVAPITPTITNASASAATSATAPSTALPSPVASESATPAPATPSAVASAGAFDATKAQASLDAVPGTQSECRKLNGPRGKWKATATFEPTGKVSDVELDKPFNRTPAGKCVIGHLKQAEVPAFAGPAQKASTIVTIAVAGK